MKPKILLAAFFLMGCFAAHSQSAKAISFTSVVENASNIGNRKNSIIVSPNPSYNGNITVTTKISEVVHFYIFDLEGTLIYQTVLKENEKKLVSKLTKGTYMYNVFVHDESIEEGKLIVK